MKNTIILTLASAVLLNFTACKKSKKTEEIITPEDQSGLKKDILSDMASNVIYATYSDMAAKSTILHTSLITFSTSPTTANLSLAQQAWKDVRSGWEQGEGFLFGPVSVDNIDPRIDTWPIDFARLDSVLASSASFNSSYINGLEESLKGFHPIEYFLFGKHTNASQFTTREKELMIALADNVKTLCNDAKAAWDPATSNNYMSTFVNAGNNSIYATQRSAYEEVVDAMAGICDEVANGKIAEPFINGNPALEESPFAQNSIVDFTNNIKSVQNMYLGKYITDGKGLEDLIKGNNIAMDGAVKTKLASALTALGNVTVPFGDAITQQPTQVQNCINAINDLKTYLEGTVKPYVQTLANSQ